MAVNVLRFDFLANDKASPTFTALEKKSDSLGSKLLGFGKIAGAALGTATVALGGLAAAGISLGVKTAASLEQAQIGFASLLKSGEKAKAFLVQLKTFAATTPFELQGLIDSSRTLIGVGLSTKQTMAALKSFGDAASAVGVGQEAFQRIMLATSQAISAGKFGIEDLNQITENGIPIWKVLADATGKPVPKLRELATAGKLLTKDVLPLLEKQMNKDYGGAMAKQSVTLNGLWSTFTDTLSLGLADAIQPMIPALKTGLANATGVAAEALKRLPGILKDITARFKIVKAYVVDVLVPGINDAFSQIGKVLPDIDLGKLGEKFKREAQEWGGLIIAGVSIGLEFGDWSGLGAVLGNGLRTALLSSGNVIKTVGTAVGDMLADVDWVDIGASVGKAALPFAVGFVAHLTDGLWTTIKEHPFDFVIALTSFLAIGKIGGALARILERIPILRAFAPLFTKIHNLTAPINDALGAVFKFLGSNVLKGFVDEVMPKVIRGIGKPLRSFAESIALRSLYFRDAAIRMLEGILQGAGRILGKLVKLPFRIIDYLTRPFQRADRWLIGKGVDLISGLLRGIASRVGRVIKIVRDVGGEIRDGFRGVGSWLYTSGRQLLTGLRNGMFSLVGAAGGWARTIGGKIVSAVKSFFGIRSPSRVFAGIGRNLISSLFGAMVDHNPVQVITKIFGGMPQALGALVDQGVVKIAALPGKALGALGKLGGGWARKIGEFVGGGSGISLTGNAAEAWIIAHESGGRTTAQNPTSTAFGLGQLLIANREHYGRILGVSPNTTDYGAQLAMFRMYVRDRYGTAENAMKFWQAHHWYDSGGIARGPGWMAKRTIQPERVLSPAQTRSFDQLVRVLDRGGRGGGVVEIHNHFPNYMGDKSDLVRALRQLDSQGRLGALRR